MNGIFEHNKLLTAEEVGEALRVKPSTISRWVQQNKIPYVKFGTGKKSIVMFNPKRLNRWVEELSHEPEPEGENKSSPKRVKKASSRTVERFNEFASTMQN
jgi:excisionase family DNA binding protein